MARKEQATSTTDQELASNTDEQPANGEARTNKELMTGNDGRSTSSYGKAARDTGQQPARGEDAATWEELQLLPHTSDWPRLGERERRRRAQLLWGIAKGIVSDGPHHARAADERGRQFIPFAALRGYQAMVDELFGRARHGKLDEQVAQDDAETGFSDFADS